MILKEKAIRTAKLISTMQNESDAQKEMDFNESEGESYLSEEESFLAAGFGEIQLEAKDFIGADCKMKVKSTSVEEHIPTQRGDRKISVEKGGDRDEYLAAKYPGIENGQ